MNTSTWRGIMAAAALLVAAGSASAQSFRAEVPMAFRAGGTVMNPGSYVISTSAAEGYRTTIHNLTDQKSAILVSATRNDAPKAWQESGDAKVTFECLDGNCRLKSIWVGTGNWVQTFPSHKGSGTNIAARPEIVTLTMIKVR